jgi:hypothetical protein
MKKIIAVIVMAIMIGGCAGDGLTVYDPATGKKILSMRRIAAMGNWQNKGVAVEAIYKWGDNCFVFDANIKDANQTDSPESAKALGEAGGNVIGAFNGTNAIESIGR